MVEEKVTPTVMVVDAMVEAARATVRKVVLPGLVGAEGGGGEQAHRSGGFGGEGKGACDGGGREGCNGENAARRTAAAKAEVKAAVVRVAVDPAVCQ